MKKVKIGSRFIGDKEPCFIIAEAGVNHNGSLKIAKKIVDSAAKAGADAVKFQSFFAKKLVLKSAKKAPYQVKTTGKGTQYKMLKKLELSKKEQKELARYAQKKKILFLSTPYDEESVDILKELKVPAYKIASADITNIPLLEKVAKTKKPIIMSTGMATLLEIKEAIETIKKNGATKIMLMHCVSEYPSEIKNANLNAIKNLKNKFKTTVGYSDHTIGRTAASAAVAIGAKLIEKHFTLNRKMKGPDHFASLEPEEFREMINELRKIESALGTGKKVLTKTELKNKKVMRRGIYAAVNIKKGDVIKKEMLAFMRPESNLKPSDYKKILGKKALKDVIAGHELKLSYFK